jgi:hypothetical protein
MRNLAKMCAVAAICLGMAGGAWAQSRSKSNPPRVDRSRPFAMVSVPRTPLSFGKVSGSGPQKLKAETTARVVANCPYRVVASFRGLTDQAGREIPLQQMTVVINGKEASIGTNRVQIAVGGPTPPSGMDLPVVIEVGVKGSLSLPAGRYGGNLVLTIIKG